MKKKLIWIGLFAVLCSSAFAQVKDPGANWTTLVGWDYQVDANIVYKKASGIDLKLDVISARQVKAKAHLDLHPRWRVGSAAARKSMSLRILPYLARGMNVVNVEYRLASAALAPAAVEDCRCALRWVYANAKNYGFDLDRLVVTGHSAGGHLSLMTGMLTTADGFDNECFPEQNSEVKVAAIVNFFGITDVWTFSKVPTGSRTRSVGSGVCLTGWNSPRSCRRSTMCEKGPRPSLPSTEIMITLVPYPEAVRLHEALDRAGVPNKLVTIPGKGHGDFNHEQWVMAQDAIFAFLARQGIIGQP